MTWFDRPYSKLINFLFSRPQIYNVTSGNRNPMSWGMIEELGLKYLYDYPFETIFW